MGCGTMPSWSPDGTRIAFDLRSPIGSEVWVMDAKVLDDLKPYRPPVPGTLVDLGVGPACEMARELKKPLVMVELTAARTGNGDADSY